MDDIWTGKRVCEVLREIRVKVARENGIDYTPAVCNHTGPCEGTCPVCERELEYLNRELSRKNEK